MAARANEIRAITILLEQEHDDVEALAKAVINTLDQCRNDRVDYCVVTWQGPMATVYGVWPGEKSASNALSTGKIPLTEGMRARVVRYYGLSAMERTWLKTDVTPPKAEIVTVRKGSMVDTTKNGVTHAEEIRTLQPSGEWESVYPKRGRGSRASL